MNPQDKIIQNPNYVHSDKYRLVFQEIPTVNFFSSSISLPGISQNSQEIPNPLNKIYVGSNKLTYETFNITFRVDEDLKNYQEIFNWMIGITSPTDGKEFRDFIQGKNRLQNKMTYNIFSDATLVSLTNASNKNVRIFFHEMQPISLSGLEFNVETEQILNATAMFNFTSYHFES